MPDYTVLADIGRCGRRPGSITTLASDYFGLSLGLIAFTLVVKTAYLCSLY